MRITQANVLKVSLILNAYDCPTCGVVFGITKELEHHRRADHATFYCPNGHLLCFKEESSEECKMRQWHQEKDRMDRRLAFIESENQRLLEEKMANAKEVKRLMGRAKAGVCPCCHRTFQQLARHMKTKHPETLLEAENAVFKAEGIK